MFSVLSACLPSGQKKVPDLITDSCESSYGCWELNSGPLEAQSMLLTSEPSLQPYSSNIIALLRSLVGLTTR